MRQKRDKFEATKEVEVWDNIYMEGTRLEAL